VAGSRRRPAASTYPGTGDGSEEVLSCCMEMAMVNGGLGRWRSAPGLERLARTREESGGDRGTAPRRGGQPRGEENGWGKGEGGVRCGLALHGEKTTWGRGGWWPARRVADGGGRRSVTCDQGRERMARVGRAWGPGPAGERREEKKS
jgi:hypothetical protein